MYKQSKEAVLASSKFTFQGKDKTAREGQNRKLKEIATDHSSKCFEHLSEETTQDSITQEDP